MDKERWIEGKVRTHLEAELENDDPIRVQRAREALEANEVFGIGNWTRSIFGKPISLKTPETS